MIQAMIWKEYREHRAVWLTLAIVSGAGLFGLTKLMAPEGITEGSGTHEMLQAVAAILAWAYGLVCGSMLLAGEREAATMTFLDMMPVSRLQLWLVKCSIGLVLFLAQVAVLAVVVVALGITQTPLRTAGVVLAMLVAGAIGMAYSLFFSARGENVLNTIGWAFVGQVLAGLVASFLSLGVLIGLQLLSFWFNGRQPGQTLFNEAAFPVLLIVVYIALTVGAIAGSARIFSQPDRLRGRRARFSGSPQPERNVWASWGRLLWLSYLQMRRLILGMVLFALGLGFLLLAAGPVVWPILTLLIGLLCGVTVFADEQLHGSFRFLGDQRLPLGRVWIVKVGMRFTLAMLASFVLMLPSLILTLSQYDLSPPSGQLRQPFFGMVLHSVLLGPVVPQGVYLTMWLLYGFAVGCLGGVLFRKSLVAGVLSLGVAALLASFWIPSLLGIGLHFWQVAGAPVILLAVARLLMPAWTADRLAARGIFLGVGAALTAVGLWVVGGLWYRVVEAPDVPDLFDMPEFTARLPSMDENKSGQAIRSAWSYPEKLMRSLAETPNRPLPPPNDQPGNTLLQVQIGEVLQRGWPDGQLELGDWLDKHFQGEDAQTCLELLNKAADHPVGVVEYVKNLNFDDNLNRWHYAPFFNRILAVRGLQLQARGDRKTFVDYLRIGLAISRNMQNFSPSLLALQGRSAEQVWPAALDLWLEKLHGSPEAVSEQLKRVVTILRQHEDELPDEADAAKADYLIAMNTLEQIPGRLLGFEVPSSREEDAPLRQTELKAAALLWRIPWEQERHRRIVRASFQGDKRERDKAAECGGFILTGLGSRSPLRPRPKSEIAAWRALQLKAALRCYQAENEKLPDTLDALVPRYLPAIPADPFDNKPFRYRLSRGEEIRWVENAENRGVPPGGMPGGPAGMPGGPAGGMPGAPGEPAILEALPMPALFVPDGQGILWAVGEDGRDDGGKKQSRDSGTMFEGEDMIFLVPPPPE